MWAFLDSSTSKRFWSHVHKTGYYFFCLYTLNSKRENNNENSNNNIINSKNSKSLDKKSSFSHCDSSSKHWLTGSNWPLLGPIRSNLSHVNASGYIFQLTFRSLSDVSYSDECRTKKASKHFEKCCRFFVPWLNSVVPTDYLSFFLAFSFSVVILLFYLTPSSY